LRSKVGGDSPAAELELALAMLIVRIVFVVLHLLGAAIWVGGHILLSVGFLPAALRERDPQVILRFEAKFERIGIPALIVQAVTGVLLAVAYLPEAGEPWSIHLIGTLSAKFVLLAATIGLAMHARLRLIPRLGPDTLRPLAAHIIAVTIIGVLLLIVGVGIRMGPSALP
jgi:putative copper export protein